MARQAPLDEGQTARLISSSKVAGTRVYNRDGDPIGEIEDVMIDKFSGEVAYAILSFGGWLGIGEKYHPLPWSALDYDPKFEGYRLEIDRGTLERAPSYSRQELTGEHAWRERIHLYYGAGPFGA